MECCNVARLLMWVGVGGCQDHFIGILSTCKISWILTSFYALWSRLVAEVVGQWEPEEDKAQNWHQAWHYPIWSKNRITSLWYDHLLWRKPDHANWKQVIQQWIRYITFLNFEWKLYSPSNVDSSGPFREYQQAHERDERVVPPQDHNEHGAWDKLSNSPQSKHEYDGVNSFLVKRIEWNSSDWLCASIIFQPMGEAPPDIVSSDKPQNPIINHISTMRLLNTFTNRFFII